MGERFAGKVSIVTGAGQGIGEAYAQGLAADAAWVTGQVFSVDGGQIVRL